MVFTVRCLKIRLQGGQLQNKVCMVYEINLKTKQNQLKNKVKST